MSTPFVALRNTISKQAEEFTAERAKKILAHPVFGKVYEEVRTAKPEVLSEPHTVDADGKRKPVEKDEK